MVSDKCCADREEKRGREKIDAMVLKIENFLAHPEEVGKDV